MMSSGGGCSESQGRDFPADSPVVLHTLVVVAAVLPAWILHHGAFCPTLDLFSRVLDRMAVMTYGAQVLPDRAFLDRPLEVTPAVLAVELEDIR